MCKLQLSGLSRLSWSSSNSLRYQYVQCVSPLCTVVTIVYVPLQYCGVNIGPVHKRDVMKASVMLEHDSQ